MFLFPQVETLVFYFLPFSSIISTPFWYLNRYLQLCKFIFPPRVSFSLASSSRVLLNHHKLEPPKHLVGKELKSFIPKRGNISISAFPPALELQQRDLQRCFVFREREGEGCKKKKKNIQLWDVSEGLIWRGWCCHEWRVLFLSLSIPVIPTPLLKGKPFNCEQGTGVISSLETNCSWKQARGEKNEGKK